MRTVIERVRWTVPVPVHVVQGSVMIWPVPSQSVQGAENPKVPRFRREIRQPRHLRNLLRFRLHLGEPGQVLQGASPLSWSGDRKSVV